jgi:hypothetical protein
MDPGGAIRGGCKAVAYGWGGGDGSPMGSSAPAALVVLVQDIAAAEVKNEGMKTVDNSSYQPNFEAKRLS